jgi:hypothetical protein
MPKGFDGTFAVPLQMKPTCVSTNAVQFLIRNQFPTHELRVSIPDTRYVNKDVYEPLRTLDQWKKWQKTVGGNQVNITCDLKNKIVQNGEAELKSNIYGMQCVAVCP